MLRALLLLLTCAAMALHAQPYRNACHYSRNQVPKSLPLSGEQKSALNASIARSDTFDILHYTIDLDVTDYAGATIRANTKIRFTPKMEGQTFIRFDLKDLVVDSVVDVTGLLVFAQEGDLLRVEVTQELVVGDTYELSVYYHGDPHRDPYWGGFYFESGYIYNLGIGLTTVPPNFGKVWYPCFDSFVERATYTYKVKSAGGRIPVCQGELVNESLLGGDTVVRTYEMAPDLPTYVSAIAVADYGTESFVHPSAYGAVPVALSAKQSDLPNMVERMADVGAAIDALQHWYGPDEWGRVGYVLTTDGALEIPTNIAYPQFMVSQSQDANRALLAHELGHHWWGTSVAPYNHNDMWLKEGPAEYSAHLVEEWAYGQEAFVEKVKDNQLQVLEYAHLEDDGFWPLSPIPDEWVYGMHTYNKGAAVMHNLRGYLGDTLFRQGMSAVHAQRARSAITPEEFRNELEAATGYSLDAFFNAWVFAPGFSAFVVDSTVAVPNGQEWTATVYVRQKLRATEAWHQSVPLDLTFIGADRQRQDHRIMVSDEFTTVQLPVAFSPSITVLNGYNRLNQARMDHEFLIHPEGTFNSSLPYVDFRLYADSVPDTTLMRIEHIWSGPDAEQLGWGVEQISSTHYWKVDGIWPVGALFHARLGYDGNDTWDLDEDLFATTEEDALLVYRATPAEPWTLYPDFTLNTGTLTNGVGSMEIDVLRKGEYAFAKGSAVIGVPTLADASALLVLPIPATDHLVVKGFANSSGTALLDLHGADGRLVQRTSHQVASRFEVRLSVSGLADGHYTLVVRTAQGDLLGKTAIQVVH
jgi:Peptidase family M1 domain